MVFLSDYQDKTETGHGLSAWTACHILVIHALGERRGEGRHAYRVGKEACIGERRMKKGEKTVLPFPRLGYLSITSLGLYVV